MSKRDASQVPALVEAIDAIYARLGAAHLLLRETRRALHAVEVERDAALVELERARMRAGEDPDLAAEAIRALRLELGDLREGLRRVLEPGLADGLSLEERLERLLDEDKFRRARP